MTLTLRMGATLATLLVLAVTRCGADVSDRAIFSLPHIGIGTAGLRENTYSVVRRALDYGVRLVDSAQAAEWYDEEQAGMAIRDFQEVYVDEEVAIVTKIHPRSFAEDKMREKLQESLDKFKRSTLDVVLLHAPKCWPGQCTRQEEEITWQTAWRNLEKLKDEFHISAIGVSNFDSFHVMELLTFAKVKPTVIQNWMDPFHQDKAVRDLSRVSKITYMAYSSLGTQWSNNPRFHDHNPVFNNPLLWAIADKYGASIAQVVISWVILEGCVAIPRSGDEEHLHDLFSYIGSDAAAETVVSVFDGDHDRRMDLRDVPVPLTEEDMDEIRSLDGILGDPWDE